MPVGNQGAWGSTAQCSVPVRQAKMHAPMRKENGLSTRPDVFLPRLGLGAAKEYHVSVAVGCYSPCPLPQMTAVGRVAPHSTRKPFAPRQTQSVLGRCVDRKSVGEGGGGDWGR